MNSNSQRKCHLHQSLKQNNVIFIIDSSFSKWASIRLQAGRAVKRARVAAPQKNLSWPMRPSCKTLVAQYLLPYLSPRTKRVTLKTRKQIS